MHQQPRSTVDALKRMIDTLERAEGVDVVQRGIDLFMVNRPPDQSAQFAFDDGVGEAGVVFNPDVVKDRRLRR